MWIVQIRAPMYHVPCTMCKPSIISNSWPPDTKSWTGFGSQVTISLTQYSRYNQKGFRSEIGFFYALVSSSPKQWKKNPQFKTSFPFVFLHLLRTQQNIRAKEKTKTKTSQKSHTRIALRKVNSGSLQLSSPKEGLLHLQTLNLYPYCVKNKKVKNQQTPKPRKKRPS